MDREARRPAIHMLYCTNSLVKVIFILISTPLFGAVPQSYGEDASRARVFSKTLNKTQLNSAFFFQSTLSFGH